MLRSNPCGRIFLHNRLKTFFRWTNIALHFMLCPLASPPRNYSAVTAGVGGRHEAACQVVPKTIWVILPTYNEAENLRRVIPALEAQLIGRSSRILIVDDASTDATMSVIEECIADYDNIIFHRRPGKLGLASALRDGLTRALADECCERICTLDADLSHDPSELNLLLRAADRAGFVQGSRYVAGGRILNWPWYRRLPSWAANRMCKLMGSALCENTTNYRIYDRGAAKEALKAPGARGFEWIVLASLAIQAAGITTEEVPITFRERQIGRSKLSLPIAWRYGTFLLRTLANGFTAGGHAPVKRSAWK